MDENLKEMLRGVADLLMKGVRVGTCAHESSSPPDYSRYCRNNAAKVVTFLNQVMGSRKANVRTVRLQTRPASSGADLRLKVYTDGIPADDLHYELTCTYEDGVSSVDVRQIG